MKSEEEVRKKMETVIGLAKKSDGKGLSEAIAHMYTLATLSWVLDFVDTLPVELLFKEHQNE